MKAKAALLYAPKQIRIEEIKLPACGMGDVIVALKKASLCPTDIKKYNADKPDVEGALLEKGPYILGHEAAGIVVEAGSAVKSVRVGDAVAIQPMVACGTCAYCRQGKINMCLNILGIGASAGAFGDCVDLYKKEGVGGCFATHLKAPEGCVMKLPQGVSMEAGSLVEPLADVVHSVQAAGVGKGDHVVIIGLGPMGLFHVAAARYFGASAVTCVDIDDARLAVAQKLGADTIVNSKHVDPVAQIRSMTGGLGANKIFVTSGGKAQRPCTEQALQMVAKEGTVSLFASAAVTDDMLAVSMNHIHYGMIRLTGTVGFGAAHAEKALELLALGRF